MRTTYVPPSDTFKINSQIDFESQDGRDCLRTDGGDVARTFDWHEIS
jgi:hypothetical protein